MTDALITTTPMVPSTTADPWAWAWTSFMWLKADKTEQTQATYRRALFHFLQVIKKVDSPWAVMSLDVMDYIDRMKAQKLSDSTIATRLAVLKSYYGYMTAKGLLDEDPTNEVKVPSPEPYANSTWLRPDQIEKMLSKPNRKTIVGRRDYAILLLAVTACLRRSELADIKVGDFVERADGQVELRYHPKGGNPKTRVIGSKAWTAVREYLDVRGGGDAGAPLWLSHDNGRAARHGEEQALTGEGIRRIVRKYTKRATGTAHKPHTLRHSGATQLYELTHDVRKTQHLLGHSKSSTTEMYLHRVDDERGRLGDLLAASFGA